MLGQLPVSSLVDIGFTALVSIACLRGFFGRQVASVDARVKGQEEVQQLESALRGLIDEASVSSNNLDRKLQQRKRELEDLFARIETRLQSGEVGSIQEIGDIDREASAWFEPPHIEKNNGRIQQQVNKANLQKYQQAPTTQQPRPPVKVSLTNTEASRPNKTLAQQIELVEVSESELSEAYAAQTGITDESTLAIAKRLLLSGKEIHVVARKLDLPLTAVRNLDRLIRTDLPTATAASGPERKNRSNQAGEFRPAAPQEVTPTQNVLEEEFSELTRF